MNNKHIFNQEIPAKAHMESDIKVLLENPMEIAVDFPMPSEKEKNESVSWILDTAMPQRNHVWEELCRTAGLVDIHTLFFGVGDCLFLAALVLCVCLFPAVLLAETVRMAACLFLFSPAFYALAHLLTMWKECQMRTLEWKRTWCIPHQTVMALRMLVFGAVSVVACVLLCVLLWAFSGQMVSFVWLLSVAFSALFLYGGVSLLCQRVWGMRAAAFVSAVWVLAGLGLMVWERASIWLMQSPVIVFGFLAVGGCAFYLYEMDQFLRPVRYYARN